MPLHTPRRGREIRAARIRQEDGHLFSTLCPPEMHGRSSGYIYWMCRCAACRAHSRTMKLTAAERYIHNQKIIDQIIANGKKKHGDDGGDTVVHGVHKFSLPKVVDPPSERQTSPESKTTRGGWRREVRPTPLAVPDALKLPPMTQAARERVDGPATAEMISKAYYEPQWSAPGEDGKTRQAYDNMIIVVGSADHKPVLNFTFRDVGQGKSEIMTEQKKSLPKAKGGGGGSKLPASLRDLLDKLKAAGCEIHPTTGSGHIKVSKNGKFVILPSTASDYRSLANSLSDAKKNGMFA